MEIHFIFGSDEFLVDRGVQGLIAKFCVASKDISVDTFSGDFRSGGDCEKLMNSLREAVDTLPLFSERHVLWLRSPIFLEKAIGEELQRYVEIFWNILGKIRRLHIPFLISSHNVDRRLKHFKQLQKMSIVHEVELDQRVGAKLFLDQEIRKRGLKMSQHLRDKFLEKVGNHLRIIDSELEKVQLYGDGITPVEEDAVNFLVCPGLEENFFEPINAFYGRDSTRLWNAIDHYFSSGKCDVRALIGAFQSKNRLLLQLKAMGMQPRMSLKECLQKRLHILKIRPIAAATSSGTGMCVFSQNIWYLLRLMDELGKFSLKQLLSIQLTLTEVFQGILDQPDQGEAILLKHLLKELAN
ncbi:MAG: hypothetical protein LBG86_01335 [Puniceicoccales bacterium]|jgi:DNA polymerase III delta subunit|nr:hypothetical protein [Puniceicoccales bacterium]